VLNIIDKRTKFWNKFSKIVKVRFGAVCCIIFFCWTFYCTRHLCPDGAFLECIFKWPIHYIYRVYLEFIMY